MLLLFFMNQFQRNRRQICHRHQRHWRQILPPVSLVLLIPMANLPQGNPIRPRCTWCSPNEASSCCYYPPLVGCWIAAVDPATQWAEQADKCNGCWWKFLWDIDILYLVSFVTFRCVSLTFCDVYVLELLRCETVYILWHSYVMWHLHYETLTLWNSYINWWRYLMWCLRCMLFLFVETSITRFSTSFLWCTRRGPTSQRGRCKTTWWQNYGVQEYRLPSPPLLM